MKLGMLAPGYADDVFIILCGASSYLLGHQKPIYPDFICRRFFRLAPLFFAVVLVSIPTQE
jgi:peptidoglycan/LPS O-acetylase OafA/YrhL